MLRSSSFSSVFLTLYYPCTVPYHHYPERVTSQQYSIFIVEKTLFQAFIMYHPSIKHHSSQVTVDEQCYFLLSHFLLYHLHGYQGLYTSPSWITASSITQHFRLQTCLEKTTI